VKLIPVLLIFFGVLLIYSAKEDKDPRNVVFEALGIKRRVPDPVGIGETDLGPGKIRGRVQGQEPAEYASPNTPGQRVVTV
jgi:hypothetical protein